MFIAIIQVSDKQRVSSWDLLEGMKNPVPLSWTWFGAVRLERRPLACEDTHRLLKYHTHNLQRPASHYLDPPPLPPEDLEPVPDKPVSACCVAWFGMFVWVCCAAKFFDWNWKVDIRKCYKYE